MSRNKKIIRNILILVIIIFILFPKYNLYLTPLSAHRASERSSHYGPSKVVHIEDFEGGKYILGKYDQWVSCTTVRKSLLLFWTSGSQYLGLKNDQSKDIIYTWGITEGDHYRVYGIINNDNIKKIQITLKNGRTFSETEFYDHMFLVKLEDEDNKIISSNSILDIKGYDEDNNLIFEEEYPN